MNEKSIIVSYKQLGLPIQEGHLIKNNSDLEDILSDIQRRGGYDISWEFQE